MGEAIARRRSVGKYTAAVPPREAIEQLLAAATRAPNHFLTQPWRFCVVAGEARDQLGQLMARRLNERKGGAATPEEMHAEQLKPTRAPVLIAVGVQKLDHPKAKWLEEIAAGAAAVENLILQAEELGLATAWRTGNYDDPAVREFFGFGLEDYLVAVVLVGYPEAAGEPRARTHFAEQTTWLGW